MLRTLGIIFGIVAFGVIISLPQLTTAVANKACQPENVKKSWAPVMVYRAGVVNIRLSKPAGARAILEKFLVTFPQDRLVPDVHYYIAVSHENEGNSEKARLGYSQFCKRYPKHHRFYDAKMRLAELQLSE